MIAPGEIDHRLIACFFFSIEMSLQLAVHVLFAENIAQPFDRSLRFAVAVVERGRDWTIKRARQTDQPCCVHRQLFSGHRTLAGLRVFWDTQFHQRDQATEVLITLPRFYEDGERTDFWQPDSDFGADMRFHVVLFGGEVKPRRAVDAVAIE